jgi:hypothetical protein
MAILSGLTRPLEIRFHFCVISWERSFRDDRLLATSSIEGQIEIWDFEKKQLLRTLKPRPA